jgi:Domain of unknown function (DUF4272)
MNTDKHGSDEIERNPPSVKRVVERALVLASLCCRGGIEQDAGNPKAEAFRQQVFEWLKQSGAETESEPAERSMLLTPLGRLSREQHASATWQAEGLVVLAWALYLAGLPAYETAANAKSLADSFGWLTDRASKIVGEVKLRPEGEIQGLADKLFALDWRLADFQLKKSPLNFVDFAMTAWFGPLNVEGLKFVNSDLSIGGYSISEASDEARHTCRLITMNRRRAAEWLLGQTKIYSDVDLST